MILDILSELNQKKIILASQSPRRRELLEMIGLKFNSVSTNVDENATKDNPVDCVIQNAVLKANAVKESADLIIASDTIVTFENKIYEKPIDREELLRFLDTFSGNEHQVYSSVVLKYKSTIKSFYEKTDVKFRVLDQSLIEAYANINEAYDKAGGYGIQGVGASFVEKINGCYFNVMGFPISAFCAEIRRRFNDEV